MKIAVRNCRANYRKTVKCAAKAFVKHLINDVDLIDSLNIKIKFVSNLGADGFCEAHDFDEDATPLDYSIEIEDDLNEQEKLQTLAHEFIHVKQYLMGELSIDHKYWIGSKIKNLEYREEPWEIEAYNREQEVLLAWKNT